VTTRRLPYRRAARPEPALALLDDCRSGRVKIQREGVLRRDMKREDGTFRGTVVLSVLADEWPLVRYGLRERLRD
jgi:hypothetical protein